MPTTVIVAVIIMAKPEFPQPFLHRIASLIAGDENEAGNKGGEKEEGKRKVKTEKEINSEIAAIIRQITASVTFLPLLNEPCSFDLLVYTNKDANVSKKWEDSDPRYIVNSQQVKLRSFTTSVHKVEGMVSYKEKDEWDL